MVSQDYQRNTFTAHLPQVSAEAAQGSANTEDHGPQLTDQNGMTPEGLHESEDSAEEPEVLPDSWEMMIEDAAGHESAHESAGMTQKAARFLYTSISTAAQR